MCCSRCIIIESVLHQVYKGSSYNFDQYAADITSMYAFIMGRREEVWWRHNPWSTLMNYYYHRDHFVYAPSQWETTLQCNFVSQRLGAYPEWSLPSRQDVIQNGRRELVGAKPLSEIMLLIGPPGNNFQLNYYWYPCFFIRRNGFENVVCEIAAILSRKR